MRIAIEQVKQGHQIELWFGSRAQTVEVNKITEQRTYRTFSFNYCGGVLEMHAPRGHTINHVN